MNNYNKKEHGEKRFAINEQCRKHLIKTIFLGKKHKNTRNMPQNFNKVTGGETKDPIFL
jgi:hypothetical protein